MMKKIVLLLLLVFCISNGYAQFNPQDRKMTEKFFPEANIDIPTPAFSKDSGFTTYKEMMSWLNDVVSKYPNDVNLSFIGESQNGKQIPFLVITRNNGQPKTRVWLQGGLHGDEPAGTEALFYLVHKLLTDKEYSYLLDKLEIGIVPMANIDGYEMHRRESANGMDLNRDQTRFSAPESIALKKAFSAFNASVALDLHEYRPFRKDFSRFSTRGISGIYDAMFLFSGNLNVPEPLRKLTKTAFVDEAKKVLSSHKYRHTDYLTTQKYGGKVEFNQGSIHSRSSATSFALSHTVSSLIEIRGVGIGRTSFKRRIESTFLICASYLKTAYDKEDELRKVLKETSNSRNDIVVTSIRKMYKDSLPVIDIATNNEIKIPVTIHNALESQAILTRKRPGAYIILPSAKRAVENLKILGLEIDSLTQETELEVQVEAYSLNEQDSDAAAGDEEEEPQAGVTTGDEKVVKQVFPKGTYIIYTDQKRANAACEVLEPENPNGFLAMKVIQAKDHTVLPVYRYMSTEKIKK